MLRALLILLSVVSLAACQRGEKKSDGEQEKQEEKNAGESEPEKSDAPSIDSQEILERTEAAEKVDVKHVLIGWKDLAEAYRGRMDPRAKERTQAEAAELAKEVAGKLREDPKAIDDLIKEHSEDPGSLSGNPYTVTANARFVPEFKKLALRLKEDEVGIVETNYGYHVMVRVPPPPPDPLESADILAREPKTEKAKVKHILLGWTEAHAGDDRGKKRSREDLETLVKETLAKLEKGAEMEPLMAELSEDPGSAKTGKSYDASPDARLVQPFKDLSLRLAVNEVGVVRTKFGIHIIKRVE